MNRMRIIIACICTLLLASCGAKQDGGRIVTVTVEPQRYFAEQIAGDKFKVESMVPAGQSPETYDPSLVQMVRIAKSCAYLLLGPASFERAWIDKVRENNPEMKFFDTSKGLHLLEDADEGHDEGHHHGGIDPHIWSSIAGARAMARNMTDAFREIDPENADYYQKNYEVLLKKINETEAAMAGLLDTLRHRTFIIYHPALTYLAHEFRLTQLCVEMDGKEPSPAQLKQLVETARGADARVVFVQREFDQKNAALIAEETGCGLTVINPLSYDWPEEMIQIAKALADGEAR